MNAREVKSKLLELQARPLDKLSPSVLKKLGKSIQIASESLDCVEYMVRSEEIMNSVPLEYLGFYQYFWKKFKIKKPKKVASKNVWEKYFLNLEKTTSRIHNLKTEYLKVFDKLLKIDEDTGIRLLSGLTREDRRVISILGSVSIRTPRGVSSFILSENESNNRRWIQELKNVKNLGIL